LLHPPRSTLFPYTTLFRSLSALESTNLPAKSNFKGHSGLDAMTGKSNFDIAEFIILQLIRNFSKSHATVAMLCKNTVIRNLVERSEEHTSELQSPYDLVCR